MSWLSAISTANAETNNVIEGNRAHERSLRELLRMRQQDAESARKRELDARAMADASADVPGLVPLSSGGTWTRVPGGVPAPADNSQQVAPVPVPPDPMKQSRYRAVNAPAGGPPTQDMAESARLAAHEPPRAVAGLLNGGYDALAKTDKRAAAHQQARALRQARDGQRERLAELVRKSPPVDTRTGESRPESERLLAHPIPGGSPQEAFIAQYAEAAKRAGEQLGIDPKVLLTQWGLETGWGKSIIPGTNNLGNIKDLRGSGTAAKDNMTGDVSKYRKFGSVDEFADHYAGLVQRMYPGAVGAGSDMGRFAAAMKAGGYAEDPAYREKLQQMYARMGGQPSTTPGLSVQQTAQAPQAGGGNAAAAMAPNPQASAQGMVIPVSGVGGLGSDAPQQLRMMQMQLSELQRRLQYAHNPQDANELRDRIITLAGNARAVQLHAVAQAAVQDDTALTSLAREAGVQFAQTDGGFVSVRQNANGDWVAASPPVDRHTLVAHLTEKVTGALAAEQAAQRASAIKTQEQVAVEREKTRGNLLQEQAKSEATIQRLIVERGLSEDDIVGVKPVGEQGGALVYTKTGVLQYTPAGKTPDGIDILPRLTPVR